MLKARKTIARCNQHTGLWGISFDMVRMRDGVEAYVAAECESGAVFATAEQANDAGDRAVRHYEQNDGVFPNMCEVW